MRRVGLLLLSFGAVAFLTGCAGLPQWLTGAEQLLALILVVLGRILVVIGGGDSNIAVLVTSASESVQEIEALVAQYKENPSPDLINSIEQNVRAVVGNAQQIITDPAATSAVVNLAQLVLGQIQAWGNVLPIMKSADQMSVGELRARVKTIPNPPMTAEEFKAAANHILDSDSSLSHIGRL